MRLLILTQFRQTSSPPALAPSTLCLIRKTPSCPTPTYDIFTRGEEVLSGSQRIHDAVFLEKKMRGAKIDPETMTDNLNGFKWVILPTVEEALVLSAR